MIIIKTPEQIEGIRKSCQLAAKTLTFLKQFAIPGNSTEFINQQADEFIRDHHAIPACLGYKGFPKSICTSLNEVICHGIPSEKDILKEGDILNIDVTTILDGYYGDTCHMYEIGEIAPGAKRLIECTKKCLEKGIEEVGPNKRYGNIGAAIYQHASSYRYSVVYQFCGHGVGLEFHEAPAVNHASIANTGPIMLAGQIFTIEPMICENEPEAIICEHDHWTARTKDGGLSAQFEHTVLVTNDGYDILTLDDSSDSLALNLFD